MKIISVFFTAIFFLLISCSKKENDISISIYKTERADNVYNVIMECDSITKVFLKNRKVDTTSLSLIELVDVLKSPERGISGSLFDIYHYVPDSNYYQFNSRAFVGSAYYIDTLKLREWLNDEKCLQGQKLPFKYKWFADTDPKKLKLAGLKSEIPFMVFQYRDVESINLSATDELPKLKETIADKKSPADSYALEVILKSEAMERLRSEIKNDDSSGFFAIVKSGKLTYVTELRYSEIKETNNIRVAKIGRQVLSKFREDFGTEVNLIER